MSDPLRPIPIQELKALGTAHRWQIEQTLAGLDSLTPVRGQLTVKHQGTVLAVKGQAATIVTLCCDRCLQHFNHPLQASADESIWLGEAGPGAAGEKEVIQTEAQLLELVNNSLELCSLAPQRLCSFWIVPNGWRLQFTHDLF